MAVMKETKPPTVVWSWVDCTSAMATTTASAMAANNWVIGTVAAAAMVWRML